MLLGELKVGPQRQGMIAVHVWRKLIPALSHWRDRYRTAVEELAGVDAILAFRLRHQEQDMFSLFETILPEGATTDPSVLDQLSAVRSKITDIQLPKIEKLMKEIARSHGLLQWLRMRKLLRSPDIDVSDAKQVLKGLGIPLDALE
jgi:hypothetical protein